MNRFIRLNIVIIPAKEVAENAIEISQRLSEIGETGFVLDRKSFHPHITCYSPEFPSKNIDRIVSKLERISEKFGKFQVVLEKLKVKSESNFFSVEIALKKNRKIDGLHRIIIERLNPLREGYLREKYKNPEYINKFPENRRKLMKKIMHVKP